MTEASAIPQYNINRAKVQRSSGLLYFLRGRCRVRFDQPDPHIAEQQRVSCRRMGALAALRVVPDQIIRAIGIHGVLNGFLQGLAQDQVVDGIPQHTAGIHGVDVVHIACHCFGTTGQQGIGHGGVQTAAHAKELAGLGEYHGVLELAAPVCRPEKAGRDAVQAVDLDDPVGQQIDAVVEVLVEIRFLRQQDDRLDLGSVRVCLNRKPEV